MHHSLIKEPTKFEALPEQNRKACNTTSGETHDLRSKFAHLKHIPIGVDLNERGLRECGAAMCELFDA